MKKNLTKGQIVNLRKSIKCNDTKVELFMKAVVMAVGLKESLLLVDDIQNDKKKNVYVPNELIEVKVSETA